MAPQQVVVLLCLAMVCVFPLCEGCVHDDRVALLDILSKIAMLPGSYLESEFGDEDCCQLDGVTCNSGSGRVMGLDVHAICEYDTYHTPWLLNATMFLPLQELRSLSLSFLAIKGCIPGAGFDVWSKFKKLRSLDLSDNYLSDDSIPSLVEISSLRYLSLGSNQLSYPATIQHLSTMKLDTLDLSGNAYNSTLSTGMCNMKYLQELHLDRSMLFGELPSCIGNLTSLKILDLSNNMLVGELPSGIGNLTSLRILDLSKNMLVGDLPSSIGNFVPLRILDLSNNLLTEKFPSLDFANLTSLEKLSLSNNNLEGVLFLDSLSNNGQLTYLDLSSSGDHFHVHKDNPKMSLLAQLEVILLQNCNLNGNSGVILGFLLHQHALQIVDLSNNKLSGNFPSWLIENNVNLAYLNLQGNSFHGHLLLPAKVHTSLQWLDVSRNRLSKLPTEINITLPYLYNINLSRNSFQCVFPSGLNYINSLTFLDLSNNHFLDNIASAFNGSKSNIRSLFLSGNNFYGSFPKHILLTSTYHLLLNDNQITGDIPDNICQSQQLTLLDVSHNKLTGSLPTCINTLQNIAILNLRGNSLVGSVPLELCHLEKLVFLDVSENNLSGPVQCLPNLQYLHLSENRLNGTFPLPLSSGTDTYTMDLRRNQFSGILPGQMHEAYPKLKVLLLEGNMFKGKIPKDICLLRHLRLLDMSHNKLFGQLPSCLSNMGSNGDFYNFLYTDSNTSVPMNESIPFMVMDAPMNEAEDDPVFIGPDQEEFMTKSRQDKYKGNILSYMTGLDFSSNQLEGYIPTSIGDMKWLLALNLSNNCFDGPVPNSLSNLSNLESLDLSHNSLTGGIPQELVELHSLEVFSVSYNNLSGPTLGRNGQFITFDQSSYEGNPYLCGPPLLNSCFDAPLIPQHEKDEDDGKVGNLVLYSISALSYVIGFWTSLVVLYIKRSWRWSWFSAVDRLGDFLMLKSAILMRRFGGTNRSF